MPSNGSFIARIYKTAAQIPVEGATVSLSQRSPTGARLLAVRISDSSGRTAPVSIEAPEPDRSLSPGQAQPWTQIDVAVDCRGYERVLIENVQIFSGVQTQQPVALLPLQEHPTALNLTEIFQISPQPL